MSKVFSWPIRVYYEDTDLGGVVYYANYLKFMERARTELLRELGVEQDELLRTRNLLFVIAEAKVKYLRPARFNDLLSVTVELYERRGSSMRFRQQIYRDDTHAEMLCEGDIRAACLDAGSFKPKRIPKELIMET
ncbi:MAG: tol-pal system-associated acyl-CoA thioesterase [Gammaproteobacteria bacterium]|nr:tol-pal system-associated acyl-CoA thioesterase [Gammaproteobacteria bacterium]